LSKRSAKRRAARQCPPEIGARSIDGVGATRGVIGGLRPP